MTNDIARATPADVGCYVDGHWGQFGSAHLIERATEFGYDDQQAIELARRHLAMIGPGGGRNDEPERDALDENEHEALIEAASDVEDWLNEHVAPEGYQFGWYEGEFFLWSNLEWSTA